MALFTVESGRLAGLKSVQVRKERAAQPKPAPVIPVNPTEEQPSFTAIRLSRVREQLNRIDAMMLDESDPQKLDRLASAQARLSEQERTLDGRPLPGSMRPSKASTARRPTVSPIEPEQPLP